MDEDEEESEKLAQEEPDLLHDISLNCDVSPHLLDTPQLMP